MSIPRLQTVGLFSALTLAAVSVSHHLTYLLAHGPGAGYAEAMTQRGHDTYWTEFLVVVGGAVLVTSVAAVRQLIRLTRQATAMTSTSVADPGVGRLLRRFGPLFLKLALLTTAAFLIQENVELIAAGAAIPGLDVLAGDHSIALPLILAVTAVLAFVRALVDWRRDVLLARLRRAGRPHSRGGVRRPDMAGPVLRSHLDASRNGTRAPPGLATAPA